MRLSAAETISGGMPERRPLRWLTPAFVAVALIAVALVWGEDRWATVSREELAAARVDAQRAQGQGQAQVIGMISYAGSALSSTEVDASTRSDLRALVRDTAVGQAKAVQALTPTRPIPALWRSDLNEQWQATVSEIEGRARELITVAAYYR